MTKKELNRYRNQLLELRDRLTEAVRRMSETVRTDAQPLGEHDRHVSETPEAELAMEQDEETIRRQTVEALKRIDEGTFGICQFCGDQIGLERLDAAPYTPYCVQCERKVEAVS
ncbi:MAG TPA: TraR/DksA C4-type zinc finger protein [Candidatus Paceibacterota bacterium]|nr:TraR/DksA C4-type zinc finger protein [Candidatus Paceibacterota bacterium]